MKPVEERRDEVIAGFFADLALASRWVAWDNEKKRGSGDLTKVPKTPGSGRNASSTDPATWGTLEEAQYLRDERDLSGVGIVLQDGLGGVDLDSCRDPHTGELAEWAQEIIASFASYTEVSPSGTGVKVFALGAPDKLPASVIPMDGPPINGKVPHIEVYVTGRYFTVTGELLDNTPDEIRDAGEVGGAWDQLVHRLQELRAKNGSAPSSGGSVTHGGRNNYLTSLAGTMRKRGLEPEEIYSALSTVNERRHNPSLPDEEVRVISEGMKRYEPDRVERTDVERPSIVIRQELTAVTDEAIKAVDERPQNGVYVRGRSLVTVGRDGSNRQRWLRRPPGAPVIVPIEHARMLAILDDAAQWRKWNDRRHEEVPQRPPDWVATQILARLEWPFPYLEAVIETPTLRPDGSIIEVPGWDEATGLLYEPIPGIKWPAVPDRPTGTDVREAVAALLDPVADFPFVADTDRGGYVAAILTILARNMIDGPTPMIPIRSPTPGTGKTLLADVIGLIGTGRVPPAMAMTYESEELRKRITSLAIAGTSLVLLDNLSGSLGSDVLAAALTKTEWEDRILGASQMVRVPLRTVWLASGNNLGFRQTLGRRVVPIDLDAGIETPEDRTGFRYEDLIAHVRERRPQLVRAALTLVRGFHLAGRPRHGAPRMGSFEAWDDLIRSTVVWAGLADPASTEDSTRGRGRIRAQADDDTESLRSLLDALNNTFGSDTFTTATVIQRADANAEFRGILDAAAGPRKGGRATSSSIGASFREAKDRPVGGCVLRRQRRTWSVDRISGGDDTCDTCDT